MTSESEFAAWAAQFLTAMKPDPAVDEPPVPALNEVSYAGLTAAACLLLRTVDDGGVPAFVTRNLRMIALENGVEVEDAWTPNQIIEALREVSRKSK